jgi:hypothetical protein
MLARACSVQVLSARGGEIEQEMPFGVARQLFEAAVHRLSAPDRRSPLEGAAGHVRWLVGAG